MTWDAVAVALGASFFLLLLVGAWVAHGETSTQAEERERRMRSVRAQHDGWRK